jgi:hypothetical protein
LKSRNTTRATLLEHVASSEKQRAEIAQQELQNRVRELQQELALLSEATEEILKRYASKEGTRF